MVRGMQNLSYDERLAYALQMNAFHDVLAKCLFEDNILLAQEVLRIILNNLSLIVTKLETQRDLIVLGGIRTVTLDVYAEDADGKQYNVEIQRRLEDAPIERARWHSLLLAMTRLKSSQNFNEMAETYVIFICEKDPSHIIKGMPFYPYELMNLTDNVVVNDHIHILYVNGEYRGDTPMGKLMSDFNRSDYRDMENPVMRETTKRVKTSSKGQKKLVTELDNYGQAVREEEHEATLEEANRGFIKILLDDKYTFEEIALRLKMTIEQVKALAPQPYLS